MLAAGSSLMHVHQRSLHWQLCSSPPLLWLVAQAEEGPHLFLPSSLTLLPDRIVHPPYKPRRARLTTPRTMHRCITTSSRPGKLLRQTR